MMNAGVGRNYPLFFSLYTEKRWTFCIWGTTTLFKGAFNLLDSLDSIYRSIGVVILTYLKIDNKEKKNVGLQNKKGKKDIQERRKEKRNTKNRDIERKPIK